MCVWRDVNYNKYVSNSLRNCLCVKDGKVAIYSADILFL
jgi:hypothetical protein